MFFFEWCRCLNVCMQCPVDVTESLVKLLRFLSRYAIIPLVGLSRRSVGAHGHVMQQTINFLFTNRFSQFLLQKIQPSAGYKHNKKINKIFNKTIWILTFFS